MHAYLILRDGKFSCRYVRVAVVPYVNLGMGSFIVGISFTRAVVVMEWWNVCCVCEEFRCGADGMHQSSGACFRAGHHLTSALPTSHAP